MQMAMVDANRLTRDMPVHLLGALAKRLKSRQGNVHR